jgi:hypothetical protein
MMYLWATLLVLLNAGWLVTVLLGLPGTWLMVASTAALAWWQWGDPDTGAGRMFSVTTLVAIAMLAALAEAAELLTGVLGATRAGGSRWGAGGALLGGFVGAIVATPLIPVPVVGTLIGACVGAAAGAWLLELWSGRTLAVSVKSGVGAGVGTLAGRMIKLAVGTVIWLIVAVAAFWP